MVYLIHFEKKYFHAQHYIGFVYNDLDKRIKRHKRNRGAKLLKALNKANIKWHVVRVWDDADKEFERKLKNKKNSKTLCPLCNQKLKQCHEIHTSEFTTT